MKKLLSILLTVVMALGIVSMVGCGNGAGGGGGGSNDPDVLEIDYWASGYGTEYMSKMVEAFEKANVIPKEYYEDVEKIKQMLNE